MTAAEAESAVVKACCAATYGLDVVALLLGDAYHPGGLALTRRLADLLALTSTDRVLDVASGRGTSALMLATDYGVRVDGVDLSTANVGRARIAAEAGDLASRAVFTCGDAEALPYPDATFDAVVCECAFCTFPDKATAAAEVARVLRPGGRVGITDVVAESARLPAALTGLAAWIACVADARPVAEYAAILTDAGLRTTHASRHDTALKRMIDQIEARLTVVRMTARNRAETLGVDFDRAPVVLAAARAAVTDGALGYAMIVADKPNRPA
jgi:ubiquinone/menaquinone biosynthesis C-methylase UbiE